MYPSRIEYPKVGEEIVFFDENYMFKGCKELVKFNTYTIRKLIGGTGVTYVVLDGCNGYLYDLATFVRPNDILLRKHKLEKINDRNRKSRVRKVQE